MSSKPAIRLGKSSAHWKYKLDDETVAQFDASNEIKKRWSYDERDEEDGLEPYKMAVQHLIDEKSNRWRHSARSEVQEGCQASRLKPERRLRSKSPKPPPNAWQYWLKDGTTLDCWSKGFTEDGRDPSRRRSLEDKGDIAFSLYKRLLDDVDSERNTHSDEAKPSWCEDLLGIVLSFCCVLFCFPCLVDRYHSHGQRRCQGRDNARATTETCGFRFSIFGETWRIPAIFNVYDIRSHAA